MRNNSIRVGGCHCGEIRFTTVSEPNLVEYCHCNSCRRLHGSAVSALAGFNKESFNITQGEPVYYESTPGVRRSFCGRCGSRLFWESGDHDHEIYISIGAFDDPDTLAAQCHVWMSDKLCWVEVGDQLPRYPEFVKDAIDSDDIN